MVAIEPEPAVIADDAGARRHLPGRHSVADALPVVSALKFLVVAMTVLFAATWILPIVPDVPVWVSAILVNGVYLSATTLVVLRAVLVPRQRLAWALLAAAVGCYTAGTLYSWVVTEGVDALPFPSVADIAWLLLYPLTYAGIIVLIRDQVPHSRVRMYLDGATAGLGGAAVFSAIVLGLLIQSSDADALSTVVALAYPAGDALLIGTLLCLLTISGWRRRGNLGMLTVSIVLFAIADTGYIALASHGTNMPGGAVDMLYLSALTLIGLAAWQKARPRMAPVEGRGDIAMLALPAVFAVASLCLLLLATEVPISLVAITLAGLTVIAIMVRTIVTFRELKAAQDEVAYKTDELQYQALHDMLTGLANRALIYDRVEQALARTRRHHAPIAAMFLDLDGFKGVNDTFGHGVGDQLLQGVSARLTGVVRDSDTVGRLGGDEFVVLVEGDSLDAGPEVIAERIKEVLATPFTLGGDDELTVYTHASIGIAVGIRSSADELLRDADVALYEAKEAGKDRYVVFAPEMQSAVQNRIELEMDLRESIGTDQFFLVYQPTFNLAAQTITGVEALLRWQHPTRGLVMPDEFIPTAEDSALIVPIGRWVLNEACRQAAAWQQSGHRFGMSVNVSGRQLDEDVDFAADVQSALAASGLQPGMLTLEITETMLMRDAAASARRLHALKDLGVRIAIDDFGTGYNSLGYIQQFPVDALKIDRSFISGISHNPESSALIHTMIQLGKNLGIETLAEGIEETLQFHGLLHEECDSGQGYLFARPLSPEALERFIDENAPAGSGLSVSNSGHGWRLGDSNP